MNWQSIYFNYDDDALIVFANAGLLRRAKKDLVANKVKLVISNDSEGQFESDQQIVTLGQQGIQTAHCNCTATDCCKHILAAVLWLQHNNNAVIPVSQTNSVTNENNVTDVIGEILQLIPETLMKQIGKAQVRKAARYMHSWLDEKISIEITVSQLAVSQLKISLSTLEGSVIYMAGAGFDGMISDFPEQNQSALHLALLAFIFNQQQQHWPWPQDCIEETSFERPLNADEIELIHSLKFFIQELLAQGLSHISQSSARQLHLLNMSARAEGLPRLAAHLRNLSGQVNLLAARHFTIDESNVLRFLARISAYLYQLEQATPKQLLLLRGQLRQQYQQQKDYLNLIPLGAQWWNTSGGAQGVTFSFWDKDNKCQLNCTQARADHRDLSFNQRSVWNEHALWKQLGQSLMNQPFTLHQPRISEQGKLASSGDSYAIFSENLWQYDDYQQIKTDLGITDWSQLAAYFEQLDDDYPTPLLLNLQHYGAVIWNEVEQCVVWPIFDKDENTLYLQLNWDDTKNQRIEMLQQSVQLKWDIIAVLVQPVRIGQQIQLQPYSLLVRNKETITTFCLDFQTIKRKKAEVDFISHIKNLIAQKKQNQAIKVVIPTVTQRLCRPILDIIETQACTGRRFLSPEQKNQLNLCLQTANELGLTLVANIIADYIALNQLNSENLLRVVYICERLLRLENKLPLTLNQ